MIDSHTPEGISEANGDEARDYAAELADGPWQERAASYLAARVVASVRLFSDEQLTRIVGGCGRELRRRKDEPPAHPFALSPVDADRMLRGGT